MPLDAQSLYKNPKTIIESKALKIQGTVKRDGRVDLVPLNWKLS